MLKLPPRRKLTEKELERMQRAAFFGIVVLTFLLIGRVWYAFVPLMPLLFVFGLATFRLERDYRNPLT